MRPAGRTAKLLLSLPALVRATMPSSTRAGTSRYLGWNLRGAVAAEGGKDDIAKRLTGVDGGVFEIAMKHMGNAFRIYAVRLGASLWVIDAFQKKSKSGIKTPQADVARIKERIKRLKETLR
jgi:phage-related protein